MLSEYSTFLRHYIKIESVLSSFLCLVFFPISYLAIKIYFLNYLPFTFIVTVTCTIMAYVTVLNKLHVIWSICKLTVWLYKFSTSYSIRFRPCVLTKWQLHIFFVFVKVFFLIFFPFFFFSFVFDFNLCFFVVYFVVNCDKVIIII